MTTIRKREDIKTEYKWKLEDIYGDENEWQRDYQQVSELVEKSLEFQGKLGQDSGTMLACLHTMEALERKVEKLYVYARMRRDENNSSTKYQELFDKAEGLTVQVNSALSYVVPEISAMPQERVNAFLEENEALKLYQHFFAQLLRQKEHILPGNEERILAMSADLSIASHNIFTMLNNADIKFPSIKDEEGHEIELTKGRYGRFMESSDRRVRKDAFFALYNTYGKLINTLGATLAASIKKDIFYARVRKYPSALHASLDQDNISTEVYRKLIESVHNNLDYMHRYMELRKCMLGLEELHMYDIYTPLVQEYRLKIPYEKAREEVLAGLVPLGEEYRQTLAKGLQSRWIDVYENEGKTSGAYSWGCYDSHPYVLLNYDDKLDDMFTLAHEMGHSMHTYYSNQHQPYVYSQYTIFLAEVASTVNESLLIDYLLKKSRSREEKMYLLNHYLEQFRGTVYRQTMFAEFEKIIHEEVENGQALTPEKLKEIYLELNRLYYGSEVTVDDEIGIEWARIPHFYSAFYVYKYATGFSAATAIKEQIIKQGEAATARYLDFLKAGSSDYPVNLLKRAGVDLTTPEPVEQALQYFGSLVKELEEMAGAGQSV